jgi:hypothetical protein
MKEIYSKEIEQQMQELYSRLPEKNRRLYAGVEAVKLGYGGISYIAQLFGCSRDTVSLGMAELAEKEALAEGRNRRKGGGRKPTIEQERDINDVFLALIKEHTAGDPMDETQKWTNLSCS